MMGTYTPEFTVCSEVGVAEDQDTQSTVNQHSSSILPCNNSLEFHKGLF